MESHIAESLMTFTEHVTGLSSAAGHGPLWFRGSKDANYELLPSLFRHATITDVDKILELEHRLLVRFKQRSVPFITSKPLTTDWEFLFLMQHYGVPTRLLDWSENAFVALWFALNSQESIAAGKTPVVWVMDPTLWNRQVFEYQKYEGSILSVGDVQLTGYEPKALMESMNSAPVSLYGTHNSPRIVAQRGVFTIAGKDKRPLEAFVSDFKDPSGCISRIEVPPRTALKLISELRGIGFSESMIFPDLEGLARELKSSEGF
jgi:FRG domain